METSYPNTGGILILTNNTNGFAPRISQITRIVFLFLNGIFTLHWLLFTLIFLKIASIWRNFGVEFIAAFCWILHNIVNFTENF